MVVLIFNLPIKLFSVVVNDPYWSFRAGRQHLLGLVPPSGLQPKFGDDIGTFGFSDSPRGKNHKGSNLAATHVKKQYAPETFLAECRVNDTSCVRGSAILSKSHMILYILVKKNRPISAEESFQESRGIG